ncbi:MAG: DNA/RNA nuclease SfsA [Gammaproteobacteria bacterium]|jgi:sugar fermentation stimulation protein A
MKFDSNLIPGVLIERYKRFLADIRLENGNIVTAHSPNTGSMLGCAEPGSRVWLRDTANPSRKYPYAWELTTSTEGTLVGINTGIVNRLVSEAIESGVINELQGYQSIRPEVKYGTENSRIDLLLSSDNKPDCFVEIKNVTAINRKGNAIFPDAVSKRATRHLRELMHVVEQGQRGIIFFCIQRGDVAQFNPADEIDPEYGQMLRNAIDKGVEALAYRAVVSPHQITLKTVIPIVCS